MPDQPSLAIKEHLFRNQYKNENLKRVLQKQRTHKITKSETLSSLFISNNVVYEAAYAPTLPSIGLSGTRFSKRPESGQ